jgi:hypothetical protein
MELMMIFGDLSFGAKKKLTQSSKCKQVGKGVSNWFEWFFIGVSF